jgi:2-dehydropantoate 2-reductase
MRLLCAGYPAGGAATHGRARRERDAGVDPGGGPGRPPGVRYVIFGAGAIGATIGARLQGAGREVVLVARGAHLDALRRDGLRLQTPEEDRTVRVPAVGAVADARPGPDDVVVLAVKSQDTVAALEALVAAADPRTVVACAQNGVANEREALRRFPRVAGLFVYLPAQLLEPGVVQVYTAPTPGVLEVGPFPGGEQPWADAIADDLRDAGFSSRAVGDVMRWKHAKLLRNLGNAVEALVDPAADPAGLLARAREEALACYAAAGIAWASDEEVAARVRTVPRPGAVAGAERGGGSSWQSLARGSGRIEADHLNGEIALLGRLHGVPTPVNAALQELAVRCARERRPPGCLSPGDVEAEAARWAEPPQSPP